MRFVWSWLTNLNSTTSDDDSNVSHRDKDKEHSVDGKDKGPTIQNEIDEEIEYKEEKNTKDEQEKFTDIRQAQTERGSAQVIDNPMDPGGKAVIAQKTSEADAKVAEASMRSVKSQRTPFVDQVKGKKKGGSTKGR